MLETLYYLLVLGSLVILLFKVKKLDKRLRVFIPLLLLSLLVEGVRFVFSDDNIVAQFLFSIYTPVEYLLLCLFITSILDSKYKRRLILISIPFFMMLSFIVQFKVESTNYFYKYLDVLVESPLILTWTLFYFFQLFSDDETFDFTSNPLFWISVGNLLFYSASFFSYGFGSYFQNMKQYDFGEAVRWIARTLNIFLYIFYIIGFLCSGQKRSFSY